jgi:hypothetical protein
MPAIGEIKYGWEIGKAHGSNKYIWHACEGCGKERWVILRKGEPVSKKCLTCIYADPEYRAKISQSNRGENSPKWKGGKCEDGFGYVQVKLPTNSFFYPMVKKSGYVLEHRLVMAKKLGRCLQPWEKVHHKGIRYTDIRNKSDNLEDNLELTTAGSHAIEHNKGYRDGYQKGLTDGKDKRIEVLQQRVTLLEAENVLLKQQLENAIEDTQLNIGDWHKPL